MRSVIFAIFGFFLFCMVAVGSFFPIQAQAADDMRLNLLQDDTRWLHVTRPLTAGDLDNRFLLLDFWTYGCINCMQIVPDLDYLEQTFGGQLLVIGVHSAKFRGEQGDERILAAAKRFGLNHPVLNDSDFKVWRSFDVHAWPTQVLLGPDGQVLERYIGEGHRVDIEKDLRARLADLEARPPPVPVASFLDKKADMSVLSFPARLAFASETPHGALTFVADSGHNRILGFDSIGDVRVVIGSGEKGHKDGSFKEAQFSKPRGMVAVGDKLYIADTENHMLRVADLVAGTVTTLAGTGERGYARRTDNAAALETALASPWDVEPAGKTRLVIANAGTHQLLVYDLAARTVSRFAGNGREAIDDHTDAIKGALAQPSGLSFKDGDLFFVDAESSALRVVRKSGALETLIGTGLFDFGHKDGHYPQAMMQHAQGLYATSDKVYVADTYNNAIRLYDRKSKALSTLTLPGGSLNEPGDVLFANGALWIVDTNNYRIMRFDLQNGDLLPFSLSLKGR